MIETIGIRRDLLDSEKVVTPSVTVPVVLITARAVPRAASSPYGRWIAEVPQVPAPGGRE
ncbi:hypothetical protein GCM10022243_12100 [Saccharothrix violaceirubra]